MSAQPKTFEHLTDNAADFCGLTPVERAWLDEQGFKFEALLVVAKGSSMLIGYVFAATDGGTPVDRAEVLADAAARLGACDVLW